jgi:hypothetical protein
MKPWNVVGWLVASVLIFTIIGALVNAHRAAEQPSQQCPAGQYFNPYYGQCEL